MSSLKASHSQEAKELALVNGVELKIALAPDDASYEKLVGIFLCPLLLKLSSPSKQVFRKVAEVCDSIDVHLSSNPAIQLPFDALLAQFKDTSVSAQTKNRTILYLSRALPEHLSLSELYSAFTTGYAHYSSIQQIVSFYMISRKLLQFRPPESTIALSTASSVYCIPNAEDEEAFEISLVAFFIGFGRPLNSMNGRTRVVPGNSLLISQMIRNFRSFLNSQDYQSLNINHRSDIKQALLRFLVIPSLSVTTRYLVAFIASFDPVEELQIPAVLLMRSCDYTQADHILARKLCDLLFISYELSQEIQIRVFQLLSRTTPKKLDTDMAQKCIMFGLESIHLKVRSAAISFLIWLVSSPESAKLELDAEELLPQLNDYIAGLEPLDPLRGPAYVVIGLMCRQNPEYARKNLHILGSLLTALSQETPVIRASISQALTTAMHAFTGAEPTTLVSLRLFLLRVITEDKYEAHYVALRIAATVLDFMDVTARWLCILALRTEAKTETIQEAHQGLQLAHFVKNRHDHITTNEYPSFVDMVEWPESDLAKNVHILMFNTLNEESRSAYLLFAWICLLNDCLKQSNELDCRQESFETKIFDSVENDWEARNMIRTSLSRNRSPEFNKALKRFQENVLYDYTQTFNQISSKILLSLLILLQDPLANSLVPSLPKMYRPALYGSDRRAHDRILAIIMTAPDHSNAQVLNYSHELLHPSHHSMPRNFSDTVLYTQIKLCMYLRGRQILPDITDLINTILSDLESKDSQKVHKSIDIVSRLALASSIPTEQMRLLGQILLPLVRTHTDSALTQQATMAVGCLSIAYESSSESLADIMNALIVDSGSQPKVEVILAKGEALTRCVGRWTTETLAQSIDVPIGTLLQQARPGMTTKILDDLLDQAQSSKSHERRGACVRLLCLVQSLKTPELQSKYTQIHAGFLALLTDQDEFVAGSANQGIQVVYDGSDSKLRSELISQILAVMKPGSISQPSQPVNIEDNLPNLSDLTTRRNAQSDVTNNVYKDMCNLAIETGNSSLFYSFLSLASPYTKWSNIKGTAGARESLVKQRELNTSLITNPDVLDRLLPKLYKYKHDPVSTVAGAMTLIFQQLYPDSRSVLDANCDRLCSELLKSMADHAWRARESAARAMTNLVTGVSLDSLSARLPEIWFWSFRILDDQKESVRLAGIDLCQRLSSMLLRSNDVTTSTKSSEILALVIPIMIQNLRSPSIDIASFSLKTLLRITKESGTSINSFVPVLIEEYLLLSSNLEPTELNYLSFHTEKYNTTQQDLDMLRAATLQTSPVFDAIRQCADKLDEDSMKETVSKICQLVRQTHGFLTKAAISHLISYLTVQKMQLFSPYADAVIRTLAQALQDRAQSVVRLFAECIGELSRLASAETLVQLIDRVSKNYFAIEDQNNAFGFLMKAVARSSNDKFKSMASTFYPLCFIAMHDPEGKTGAVFRTIWQENTGSAQALALYMPEILPMVEDHLSSPIWRIKHMAANTITEIAQKVNLGHHTDRVFEILIHALSGKSWAGKEAVLAALVGLTSSSSSNLDQEQRERARMVVHREARRTNMSYKNQALVSLASFIEVDEDKNSFVTVWSTVEHVLDGSAMTDDSDDLSPPLLVELVQHALTCLIKAFKPRSAQAQEYALLMKQCHNQVSTQSRTFILQVCQDLSDLFSRISHDPIIWVEADVRMSWQLLEGLCTNKSFATVREQAGKTTKLFAAACIRQNISEAVRKELAAQLSAIVTQESDTIVRAVLQTIAFQ